VWGNAISAHKRQPTKWLLYGLRSQPERVFVGRSVLSNRATDRAEDAPGSKLAVLAGRKCEGATGSLAIVVSGHSPSHPRSLHHGSRLPAMPEGSRKAEIKSSFVARPLFRPRPNAYQIPQTARVLGAPRQHSPFRAILGVLSGNLYGLIDCGLLTSGLLRRVTQGNEQ